MTLAPVHTPAEILPHVEIGVGRVTLRDELALWRESFELAQAIAGTPLVPVAIRNNPPAVMATMLKGLEIGVAAFESLNMIDFIEGRPALRAELMRAVVLANGHDIWPEESTNTHVTLLGRRAEKPEVTRVTWTMDDAKRAHLDGKDNWRRYPRAMLLARATGELCRLRFADVLHGMSYTVEELEDLDVDSTVVPPDGSTAAPTQTRSSSGTARKGSKRRAPAAGQAPPAVGPPQPPLPGEEDEPSAPPGDEGPALPAAQAIAMRASRQGVDHHHVVDAVTNGERQSAKDLPPAVAQQVIDALAQLEAGEVLLDEKDDGGYQLTTLSDARAALGERLAAVDRTVALAAWREAGLPKREQLDGAGIVRAREVVDQLEIPSQTDDGEGGPE